MKIRNLLKVGLLSLGVVLLLLAMTFWMVDFGRFKSDIETAVSRAIGRPFNIGGTLSIKLLPSPRLLIENAGLASPSWGTEPTMLRLGKVAVTVDLWSLIFQPIILRDVVLKDIRVLIESNQAQALNWNLPSEPEEDTPQVEEANGEAFNLPIEIQRASVNNLQIVYRQADSEDYQAVIDELSLSQSEADKWQLKSAGRLAQRPYQLKSVFSRKRSDMTVEFDKVGLSAAFDYPNDALAFKASVDSLAELGKVFDVEGLPSETLSVQGNIVLDDDRIELKNIVANLTGMQLSAETELVVTGEVVDIHSFSVNLADNTVTGSGKFEGGEAPSITLDAHSELLDLSPFLANGESDITNEKAKASEPKSGARYVFDEAPLPLDTLKSLNLDIQAEVKQLIVPQTEMKELTLEVTSKDSQVVVNSGFEGVYGGKYSSRLQLNLAAKQPELNITTQVDALKILLLSGPTVPPEKVPVTVVQADLRAQGEALRALASSLNGRLVINQGAGLVSNELIERFSGDIVAQLFKALNPFAEEEEFTNWECSVLAINFESGRGMIDGFLLQSEKLVVVGGGNIDLNNETLDFEFNTKPRQGVGISADMFVTPFVKLTGTLTQPKIGLNQKGLLLSGGAAVLTGGMSFLYSGVIDRVTAQEDRCEMAVTLLENSDNEQ